MDTSDKTEDPSFAYAYASFDTGFLFFRLQSKALRGPDGDIGVYDYEFRAPFAIYHAEADKIGWLRAAVRHHLAHVIAKTKLPSTEWLVEFSPVMEELNIPSHLDLAKAEDCKWLLP